MMNGVSVARTVALALAAFAAQAAIAQALAAGSADARLKALYEREWQWRQEQGCAAASGGDGGDGPTHLPKVDAATQKARFDYWTKALAELDTIPADQLSPEEKVNAAVFRQSIETMANDIKYKIYEAPFNADTFFWSGLNPRSGGFATAQAYRNYIARMRDIPRFFDEQTANMQAGLARGFRRAQIAVQGRDVTIKPYLPADQTNAFTTRSRKCRRRFRRPNRRRCAPRARR